MVPMLSVCRQMSRQDYTINPLGLGCKGSRDAFVLGFAISEHMYYNTYDDHDSQDIQVPLVQQQAQQAPVSPEALWDFAG